MEVKIIKTEELNGLFRVHTECPYGIDNIGLSTETKYLNPYTEEPRWKKEVKDLLEKKYNKKVTLKDGNTKSRKTKK